MSTVQEIVTRARQVIRDLPNSHYVIERQITNGLAQVFQVNNKNVIDTTDGAPKDPALFVAGGTQAYTQSASDKDAGLFDIGAPPSANLVIEFRYYHQFFSDTELIGLLKNAAGFCGGAATFTQLTDDTGVAPGYDPAMVEHVAGQACRALASMTHWYYQANAGNKSFNMDQISRKFLDEAKEHEAAAAKRRMDVNTRFDRNQAPAASTAVFSGMRSWEPRR